MRTVRDVIIYSNNKVEKIRALFDTDATVNYIKKEIGLKFPTRMKLSESFLIGLGGKKQRIAEQLNVTVQIGKFKMPAQNFFLADIKKFDAIIGAFFMEQWGVVLSPKEKKLKIKKKWIQLQEEFGTTENTENKPLKTLKNEPQKALKWTSEDTEFLSVIFSDFCGLNLC